jgi:hypothetical protein
VSKSEVAAHCGEFCEVRPFSDARYYGRLLRLTGDRFELEVHDRCGRSVAVFTAGEVASIVALPAPHF